MVAQEERIYDEYLLKRLDAAEAQAVVAGGDRPADFISYESVLNRSGDQRSLRVPRRVRYHSYLPLRISAGSGRS
jgi:hypothetical protein